MAGTTDYENTILHKSQSATAFAATSTLEQINSGPDTLKQINLENSSKNKYQRYPAPIVSDHNFTNAVSEIESPLRSVTIYMR